MSVRWFDRWLLVTLTACAAVGCQQQPAQPLPLGPRSYDFSDAPPQTLTPTAGPLSPDALVSTDPTATRLQDIGGFLLLYYSDNQQMPASLDDLRSLPGGADLQFTSPATGQAFGYAPSGMWSPQGGDKCIVLYDTNLRGGKRWCLLMTPPKAGAALSVDVANLPDSIFLNYRAAGQ